MVHYVSLQNDGKTDVPETSFKSRLVKQIEDLEPKGQFLGVKPTQFGSAAPVGEMVEFNLLGRSLNWISLSGDFEMSGPMMGDTLFVGVLIKSTGLKMWSKQALAGDVFVIPAGETLFMRLDGHCELAMLEIDLEFLKEQVHEMGLSIDGQLTKADMHRTGSGIGARAAAQVAYVCRSLQRDSGDADAVIEEASYATLVNALLEVLGAAELFDIRVPRMERLGYELLTETRELIQHVHPRELDIDALVSKLGVSRRQLYRAFNCHLGLSPAKYLKLYRMSRVRRDLSCRKDPASSVNEAALQWGFTELGRFAGEYKAQFSEHPSATLRAARSYARFAQRQSANA